jgi:hypothetical protein
MRVRVSASVGSGSSKSGSSHASAGRIDALGRQAGRPFAPAHDLALQ